MYRSFVWATIKQHEKDLFEIAPVMSLEEVLASKTPLIPRREPVVDRGEEEVDGGEKVGEEGIVDVLIRMGLAGSRPAFWSV